MGKTKSKPTGGKKKGIVSKTSTAKHSVATNKKKASTANKTVVSKRHGAATRHAAQVPSSVTPPPLCFTSILRAIFTYSCRPRAWRILTIRSLQCPLFISSNASVRPQPLWSRRLCKVSRKNSCRSKVSLHMRWKQVHPNVSILQCETPMDGFSREQLLLYSELPTQVEAEQPEPVKNITITWNETKITWMKGDGETLQECVDTEISTASNDDKALVQNLLEQEREHEMAKRKKLVEEKKALYNHTIETQDMSVAALQERRVFKIYPEDARLEPSTVTFGNTQFKTASTRTLASIVTLAMPSASFKTLASQPWAESRVLQYRCVLVIVATV